MTMMISKFHKLIQSRLLWGAFLIVIVFSFVIWGMVWPSDVDEAERQNAAGLLDNRPVSHGEFRSAYRNTYLARALSVGREIASTPENEAILRQLAWQRLATLRQAAQLGIAASEDDLVSAIRSNFVDEEGRYQRARYEAFLQSFVRPMGFTPAQFEHHLREEIAIQKLGSLIGRQAYVTPLEIRRTYETLLDSFVVDYVKVATADIEKTVTVTEEEAQALYDENPEAFTLPEQREIMVATFPIAEFLDPDAEIAEDDILDYYELNIDDYTTTEEDEDGEPRTVVMDLDDARESILTALRRKAAIDRADAVGTELAFRSMPDRDGRIPDFTEEAEKVGRPARSLPPFSRRDTPLEDVDAAFVAAAFELEENAFNRVSVPVVGQDNVYVLYLSAIHAPRVPAFHDIQDRVTEVAQRRAVFDALGAQAQKIQQDAVDILRENKSFATVAEKYDLEVIRPDSFTGLSGSSAEDEAVQALVQAVVAYNQGEVTEPLAVSDGLLVAYIVTRTPADPANFGAYRDEIASAIRNRRAQGLFVDWQEALLTPERFIDYQRLAPADDDAEDGEDIEGEDSRQEDIRVDAAI